jgi:RNA polymerase sigma-70 factor (TIGR02960 family)
MPEMAWQQERLEHNRLARAQRGDEDAFAALTEPYRRELQLHCYRIVGSLQDAEDLFQETLLAAWRGLEQFEGRSSLRAWLYTIATNRCLNALRDRQRRPQAAPGDGPAMAHPPESFAEISWLTPYPDSLLEGVIDRAPDPAARYEAKESVALAFVSGLQHLAPRQRAVLVLRDVLGFHAHEVADMLDSTVESVTSALKRARAGLERSQAHAADRARPPVSGSAAEEAIVARFVRAYESADLDSVVALLTADAFVSMPPMPFVYEGRDVVARFCGSIFGAGRRFDLVPTRANGQPAFGAYLRGPAGIRHATGFYVLTLAGGQICGTTRFEASVLPWFGLPRSLPSR